MKKNHPLCCYFLVEPKAAILKNLSTAHFHTDPSVNLQKALNCYLSIYMASYAQTAFIVYLTFIIINILQKNKSK